MTLCQPKCTATRATRLGYNNNYATRPTRVLLYTTAGAYTAG